MVIILSIENEEERNHDKSILFSNLSNK
jgi:hypothetical protein